MVHYSPYSGKRKGEHYVKLAQVEKDSLERLENIAADIAGSRHTDDKLKGLCERLAENASALRKKINKANELSLLSKEADEQLIKSRDANKAFSKAGKENKPK